MNINYESQEVKSALKDWSELRRRIIKEQGDNYKPNAVRDHLITMLKVETIESTGGGLNTDGTGSHEEEIFYTMLCQMEKMLKLREQHYERFKAVQKYDNKKRKCYCGQPVDTTNPDCDHYNLCKDHAEDA